MVKLLEKIARAVNALAVAVEKVAAALTAPELPMAERGVPRLRFSVTEEHGGENGGGTMSLAVALNNRQMFEFTLTPAVVDADGQAIKGADGNPLDPASIPVAWAASDPSVAVLDAIAPDGKSGAIKSGAVGTAEVTASIGPYPDGSTKQFVIEFAVGNSAPGEPTVAGEVKDEPAV